MTHGFFQYPQHRPSRSGPYLLPSGQYAYYCRIACSWHAAADTPRQATENFNKGRKAIYNEWKGAER